MRTLAGLIRKEFIQIFRDHKMVVMIFITPILQLIIFGYVANIEVKLIDLDIYDYNRTQDSRELVVALKAGEYFVPQYPNGSLFNIEERFREGETEMALVIPEDFSQRLVANRRAELGLIADGSNSNMAAIGLGYASQIVNRYAQDKLKVNPPLDIHYHVFYNPEMESVYFMVPGILVALLTMLTVMLTSMAIVREREYGTLEQLMVTPMSTPVLLLGKILPFAFLGLFEMFIALTMGILWFSVPFAGSPVLLFSLAGLYLLTTLGMGLFFSTVTSTQQQAMFFAWFFFVFALLTSGLFTPVANMPQWMQYITYINPMRFFLNITRGIMMRGAGLADLWRDIIILAIYGITIFTFSVLRFTKRIV
ncbi:MAG: ABC transporter permease [candidate division Zixibacteria bacterium]|nr:ABC transporter permease [candidate division Zixibacteria bacterium]